MNTGTHTEPPRSAEGPSSVDISTARRWRDSWHHGGSGLVFGAISFLLDVTALAAAFYLAFYLREVTGRFGPAIPPAGSSYVLVVGVASLAVVVFAFVSGAYRPRRSVSRMDELFRTVSSVSSGLLIGIAFSSLVLGQELVYSRQVLAYGWLLAGVLVTAARLLHAFALGVLRRHGISRDRVLIVGTSATSQLIVDKINRSPQLGFDVVGFVSHSSDGAEPCVGADQMTIVGDAQDIDALVQQHDIDEIIVALSHAPHEDILALVYALHDRPVAITVYPESFRLLTNDRLSISDLNGLPTVSVRTIGLRRIDRFIKRGIDIVFSTLLLIALSPVLLLLAGLVKLSSRGPVFYVQERVSRDGRAFQLLKFRSMPVNAEERSGPIWSSASDTRATSIGRLMRRFSLDELPQFINVLLGEMSIVGPRPERPYFVEQFRQVIPAYMARHTEKSGVTGWAQVNGLRGDTSIEERTRYDLYYVENWSVLFDLKIMAKTLVHVFSRDNNAG